MPQTEPTLTDHTQTRINIRVLFFGAARDAAKGVSELTIETSVHATAATFTAEVCTRFPALARFGRALLVAVNEEYATPDTHLHDDDEVAFFPPVSGGSDGEPVADTHALDFYELTVAPVDITSIARRVVPPEAGATVTLDGYVREWTRERRTLHLVYEAYEPMALRELRRLGEAAHRQFDIAHVGIVHRTGKLDIGETSVCISVSAPHRRAAFAACEWLIKELKRTVPIWKKEFYEDGEVWVEGEGQQTPLA